MSKDIVTIEQALSMLPMIESHARYNFLLDQIQFRDSTMYLALQYYCHTPEKKNQFVDSILQRKYISFLFCGTYKFEKETMIPILQQFYFNNGDKV